MLHHDDGFGKGPGESGRIDFRVDGFGGTDQVLLFPGVVFGEIDKVEAVAQIPQDLLLKLTVIVQTADSVYHEDGIGACFKCFDHAAQRRLERRTDKIRAVFGPQLLGAASERGRKDAFAFKSLLHDVFHGTVVLRVARQSNLSLLNHCSAPCLNCMMSRKLSRRVSMPAVPVWASSTRFRIGMS